MADDTMIESPFGGQISRDYFGAWLSGFVDGEASFILRTDRCRKGTIIRSARFSLTLRRDDLPTLEAIRSYWGVGSINLRESYGKGSPLAGYSVSSRPEFRSVLIPHFHRFPLVAKKRRDFEVWERGVEVLERAFARRRRSRGLHAGMFPKWTEDDCREFDVLIAEMTETRRYDGVPSVVPESMDRPSNGHGLLFEGDHAV